MPSCQQKINKKNGGVKIKQALKIEAYCQENVTGKLGDILNSERPFLRMSTKC